MVRGQGVWCALAAGVLGASLYAVDKTTVFDKGEKDDFEKGVVYKPEKKIKPSNKPDTKTVKAISYHVKNLKDPDAEVRQSSAEMLGILGAYTATPDLIDVLRPGREDKVMVMLSAHGALVRITGKNFGYKNYDEWMRWWASNKEEFLRKAETGTPEQDKIAAVSANTLGLELMRRGEYAAAQGQFLIAVDKDPSVPDYKNNLGLAVMEQGRFLDAMVYFEETIGQNPELPQPYMNVGHCYSRMNKSIEAQTWYKKAMEIDKQGRLWEPFWMLGREFMKRAEWTMAYEYLDQARVKAEKNRHYEVKLYKDLAITHFGMDQYHSAWKEIKNVQTLGYDCDPGFVAKVRKALVEQGIDPDAEDKKARKAAQGEDETQVETSVKKN